jgi:hypothetical protein
MSKLLGSRFIYMLVLGLSAFLLFACSGSPEATQTDEGNQYPSITDLIATLSATETTPSAVPTQLPSATATSTENEIVSTNPPPTITIPVSGDGTAEQTQEVRSSPTYTAVPQPTATMEVLFQDNFDMAMGWYTFDSERYRMEFKDGGYIMYNNLLQVSINSVRTMNLEDVYMEVDATRVSGPPNVHYGLVCRFQDDSSYYALVLGSDGFYGIARLRNGVAEFITPAPRINEAIKGGFSVNRIGASCIGDKLTLYANGEKLVEATDSTYQSGFIGLTLGTKSVPGGEVRFDNFKVYKPGD